jgi:chromosome segregation ATPase
MQTRLMKMARSKTATPEEQNKLQDDQTKALADCNDKVGALEKTNTELMQQNKALETTNTGLTQQNETLHKQELKAREAEEKANKRAETLQEQVETLTDSLSNAEASVEQQREATAVGNSRLYEKREELAAAQDSVNNLQRRIKQLELDLENEQARNSRYLSAGQDLEGNKQELQQQIVKLQQQKEVLENELANMQEDRDNGSKRANNLQEAGDKLQADYDAQQATGIKLEAAYNDQLSQNNTLETSNRTLQQRVLDAKKNCDAEKRILVRTLDDEKRNSKALRDQRDELKNKNDTLEPEKTKLEEQNFKLRLEAQINAEPEVGQPPQQTPFSNLPSLPPPQTGSNSGGNSPTFARPNTNTTNTYGRPMAKARSRSPKKQPTGEPEDPAQDILDSLN